MQNVAFLGLGVMGRGMARRLSDAGFPLTVYNRGEAARKEFESAGVKVAKTPREAAKDADVVIAMVSDDNASRSVWTGDNGALAGAKSGAVLIESSTLSPEWIGELAVAAKAKGCEFLDAPVTGSKPQAESGQLLFLVGGDADVLDSVRPVLQAMSRDAIHAGPSGSGSRLKLVNNFMSALQVAGLAEALASAERGGLDRDKVLQVLTNGAPGSPMVKTAATRAAASDYTTNFELQLMVKDLTYAIEAARRSGVTLETGNAALRLYQTAKDSGFGTRDFCSVIESVRTRNRAASPSQSN